MPAGKYRALPVTTVVSVPGPDEKDVSAASTAWHARDVGLVKLTGKLPGGPEIRQVLKSFSPGL